MGIIMRDLRCPVCTAAIPTHVKKDTMNVMVEHGDGDDEEFFDGPVSLYKCKSCKFTFYAVEGKKDIRAPHKKLSQTEFNKKLKERGYY